MVNSRSVMMGNILRWGIDIYYAGGSRRYPPLKKYTKLLKQKKIYDKDGFATKRLVLYRLNIFGMKKNSSIMKELKSDEYDDYWGFEGGIINLINSIPEKYIYIIIPITSDENYKTIEKYSWVTLDKKSANEEFDFMKRDFIENEKGD